MSAIARGVENCFLDSGQRAVITALVLEYLNDKVPVVFNRFALQTSYAQWHGEDALRTKPLRIVYLHGEEQQQQIRGILEHWQEMTKAQLKTATQGLKPAQSETRENFRALMSRHQFWNFYSGLIGRVIDGVYNTHLNTVVVNAQNGIEAISYSHPDDKMPQARCISCMISAPKNHIRGHPSVRGAGTALIEHAALQSLKQQGLDPDADLTQALSERAVVTLQASTTSTPFYYQLFFKPHPSYTDLYMILEGENMGKFFTRFGGRATCPKKSIEIRKIHRGALCQ